MNYYSELNDSTDYYFLETSFALREDEDPQCAIREVQIVSSKHSGAIVSLLVKTLNDHVYVCFDSCRVVSFEKTF